MDEKVEKVVGLMQAVMIYSREKLEDRIDKAYEYFFEEEFPEDILSGAPLDLAFINFEDWFVCDYRTEDGRSPIDFFVDEEKEGLGEEDLKTFEHMKNSLIRLVEIKSVVGAEIVMEDIFMGGELKAVDEKRLEGIAVGDLIAARFIDIDGKLVMTGAAYPFGQTMKERVLGYVEKQFSRYARREKDGGTKADFSKKYSDIFNIIWMNGLLDAAKKQKKG